VTVTLLASIHPALVLLALFAGTHRADVYVAPGCRTRRKRTRRAAKPVVSSSLHCRNHGSTR
jgi:hypothetical protein